MLFQFVYRIEIFFFIVFYSCRDASHAEICFVIHSHSSWPHSGDCGGSRIRTRDSCVLCLMSPSCFNQLSHHIPLLSHHIPLEPPHPLKLKFFYFKKRDNIDIITKNVTKIICCNQFLTFS
jgi:hypothetical protein